MLHWFTMFTGSLIHEFIRSFSHWLIDSWAHSLVRPCIDSLIHWITGSLRHWFIESAFHWFSGSFCSLWQRFCALLIHFIESSIHCFIDSLIRWFIGSLIHWFVIGSLVHRFTGWLAVWFIESLLRCFIDLLIHDFIESLIHWFIDSLVHSFSCAGIRSCHFTASQPPFPHSLVDAPHKFNRSWFLHLKNVPMGRWFPVTISDFPTCRSGAGQPLSYTRAPHMCRHICCDGLPPWETEGQLGDWSLPACSWRLLLVAFRLRWWGLWHPPSTSIVVPTSRVARCCRTEKGL